VISLETAKKLKKAGLKWEPRQGDWIYNHHGFVSGTTTTLDLIVEGTVLVHSIARDYLNRTVEFAPRLDQLLAEIEKRGHRWEIGHYDDNEDIYYIAIVSKKTRLTGHQFTANSPEESAANALLWIYEQEGKHESTGC